MDSYNINNTISWSYYLYNGNRDTVKDGLHIYTLPCFLLSAYIGSQNIEFSFDVFNNPSVVSGLTIDTRYFRVHLVSAATPEAAGGSWGVTFTETGTMKQFFKDMQHRDIVSQTVGSK